MHVCLITPPLQDRINGRLAPISMDAARTCPPYGAYLLSSVLRSEGIRVSLIDLIAQGNSTLAPFISEIMAADLIGISVSSLSWPTARDCIDEIRRYRPDVPIALGGVHATMFDRYLLSSTSADFVNRGEGERSMPALCRALTGEIPIQSVPNLSYKSPTGKIIRNRIGPLLTADEIASFPVPDYSSLPSGVYAGLGIESSRGCAFDCNFCSTSYRKTWRGISAERFVDRIEQVMPYLSLTSMGLTHIIDDEFSTDADRAAAICNEFTRRGINLNLVFSSRANDLLNEAFTDAVTPFVHQFLVGAECGYEEGLKTVGKGTTCEKMKKAAAVLHQRGIAGRADFSFVLGFPWETKKEVMQTVQFAYDLCSVYGVRILFQWYCQIPGSRLWAEQREKEVFHESHYDEYGFFRNLYLFRTGVRLKPSEIFEVQSSINALQSLIGKNQNGMSMIECSVPEPIFNHYPEILSGDDSLKSLRETAGVQCH